MNIEEALAFVENDNAVGTRKTRIALDVLSTEVRRLQSLTQTVRSAFNRQIDIERQMDNGRGLPRCGQCGKVVRYNVPRLGPGGGYVHADDGSFLCVQKMTPVVKI